MGKSCWDYPGRSFFQISFYSSYEMFESEYSQDNYKSLKISIGTIIKNSEMLRFVPDTLKLKRSKNAVTKLPFRTK